MSRKILLMYITAQSGHYQAAKALEKGLHAVDPSVEILTIDAFQYLNPILARVVDQMYMSVIQTIPELWDYLYDNPKIVKRTSKYRELLHRYDSPRLKGLMQEYQPDAVACTQAFPCGLVADYKKQIGSDLPLFGVVTDFTPHTYWIHEEVNGYMVPAQESKEWLVRRQISPDKVFDSGIPIHPVFAQLQDADQIRRRLQLKSEVPTLLLMGGGQGLGPLLKAVRLLDSIQRPLQLLVVAGTNTKLYHKLIEERPKLNHLVQVFGHVDYVAELMSVSDLLVTKPGGLTASEALAKGLPLVILEPIPGQEIRNANFLTRAGVAVEATRLSDLPPILTRLLDHPEELTTLSDNARRFGHPDSAIEIAHRILEAAGRDQSQTDMLG